MDKTREIKKIEKEKKVSPLIEVKKEKTLQAFIFAFIAFAVVILPITIYTKGYFIYYGDFNSQQLPFYYHASEMIKNGDFLWDWGTDLGANFIGSYSFYLLFSPFFWLSLLLKQEYLMYAMSVLLCLKYAFASVTAYIYIRKFVKNVDCALIGALLYAFSGFQSFNVFFNHFHDVTAFFPLLLCAFEDRINKDKRGIFALAIAFMAALNYYFFAGQIIFGIIYLIMRCSSSDFKIDAKKYGAVLLEAVIGVMIACVALLPSALAIIDNPRVDDALYGIDMVAYSDNLKIWKILQGFFMIPDAPARPNLFDNDNSQWASIAGYLPLFSMAGVIVFMDKKRQHWASRLVTVCIICAFVPFLNSMFYMFNGSYYARWFYMPILIMAMMTASALEDKELDLSGGIKLCGYVTAAFGVIALLPTVEDGEVKWFSLPENGFYFYIPFVVSIVCLIFANIISKLKNEGKPFLKQTLIAVLTASCLSTATIVYFGVYLGPHPETFINSTFKAEEFVLDVPVEPSAETEIIKEDEETAVISENDFFRVDMCDDYDNYPMFWGFSSIRNFHSIVPASIMEFYSQIGITRDVCSEPPYEDYMLRGFLSTKYYFADNSGTEKSTTCEIKGFEYLKAQNNFDIYENKHFVPMGFTYEYYMPVSQTKELTEEQRKQMLIKAIVVDDQYVLENQSTFKLSQITDTNVTEEQYYEECEKRKASACYSFEYGSEGFTAKTNLTDENLVFFTVPYDKGWTAYVNGVETEIIKTNYGFMAVKGEVGENIIKFSYLPYGLTAGIIISAVGLLAFILYLLIGNSMLKNEVTKSKKKHKKHSKKNHSSSKKKRKEKNDGFVEETITPEEKHFNEDNSEEIEKFMRGYTGVMSIKKSADDFKNDKLFEDIENKGGKN